MCFNQLLASMLQSLFECSKQPTDVTEQLDIRDKSEAKMDISGPGNLECFAGTLPMFQSFDNEGGQ